MKAQAYIGGRRIGESSEWIDVEIAQWFANAELGLAAICCKEDGSFGVFKMNHLRRAPEPEPAPVVEHGPPSFAQMAEMVRVTAAEPLPNSTPARNIAEARLSVPAGDMIPPSYTQETFTGRLRYRHGVLEQEVEVTESHPKLDAEEMRREWRHVQHVGDGA